MAVNGLSGLGITGTLSNGVESVRNARREGEENKFLSLVREMSAKSDSSDKTVSGVSSSQIQRGRRLNGDYTNGFYNAFTSESDKKAAPKGFAANSASKGSKKITIDKTSELYEQSLELENYMVKMMLSSMRNTIQKSDLLGKENSYARDMYEDMMYDNVAESITKNAGLGLADQIYIEMAGLR